MTEGGFFSHTHADILQKKLIENPLKQWIKLPLLCHFIVLFLPKPEPQNVILGGIKTGCVSTTQPLVCSESVRGRKTRPDVFEALSQVPAAARTAASRRSLERQMEATGQRWRLRGRLEIQIQPAETPQLKCL